MNWNNISSWRFHLIDSEMLATLQVIILNVMRRAQKQKKNARNGIAWNDYNLHLNTPKLVKNTLIAEKSWTASNKT